jgi:nitroreductase
MTNKTAVTQVSIDPTIAKRWSPRAFDATRLVEREKLLALIEAARWAPSCFGDEPWRFIVCDKSEDSEAWEKLLGCLVEKNQLWARNAPVLMFATSVPLFSHNGNANRWNQYDTGAASENLCLQAASTGLIVHQMGGFDVDKAHEVFGIPAEVDVMAAIAVGYEGDINELHEDFRGAEEGERARKPIGDQFFAGQWGKAFLV